jgi:type IV secretion system protein VirB8
VAVVRYRYSTEPMKLEDRFVNPLGFQVTSYRRDPEAVPPSAATPPAAAPAANAAPPPYYAPAAQPQQSGAAR